MHDLHYQIGFSNPSTQLIEICLTVRNNTESKVQIQLPSWRPGRYELGNFAKNIRSFSIEKLSGEVLNFQKIKKDLWEVETPNTAEFKVVYTYYACELNAGSSYLDVEQLYVNPVNCCVYIPNRINEACVLEIKVPSQYQIAIDLPPATEKNQFDCSNFDRLADAPFIASAKLQHQIISTSNHHFHLWFMGDVQPDWERLNTDFKRFCDVQVDMMGNLPAPDYHFYFQILPTAFYHGVEHTFSTVCALGPGTKIFKTDFYDELLGVSSHELFHAWNVKTIRPSEMLPYDFTTENYSRMGWVYEGITTWYGDQFLLRSGVFDSKRYLKTLNDKLNRHFSSYGRFNQAVAEASFDTWLDGYVPGIPHRKTSIYVEGSLVTCMMDFILREKTNDTVTVDDLMRRLYADARNGMAYSKERILQHLQELSGISFESFYESYIEGKSDFEPQLEQGFARIGMKLEMSFPLSEAEHRFGIKLQETAGQLSITMLAPGSPAEKAGLMAGDVLLACNGRKIAQNWSLLTDAQKSIQLHVFSKERLVQVDLAGDDLKWFVSRTVSMNPDASPVQRQAYQKWAHQDFPQ